MDILLSAEIFLCDSTHRAIPVCTLDRFTWKKKKTSKTSWILTLRNLWMVLIDFFFFFNFCKLQVLQKSPAGQALHFHPLRRYQIPRLRLHILVVLVLIFHLELKERSYRPQIWKTSHSMNWKLPLETSGQTAFWVKEGSVMSIKVGLMSKVMLLQSLGRAWWLLSRGSNPKVSRVTRSGWYNFFVFLS